MRRTITRRDDGVPVGAPRLRAWLALGAAVGFLAACGAAPDSAETEAAAYAAQSGVPADAVEESAFDSDAWCEIARASIFLFSSADPDRLEEDIERLERMTELTSGEMRAAHEAGLAVRRQALAVARELIEPGMDPREREAAVAENPRIREIMQPHEVMVTESRLMGYHMEYCL